LVALRSKNTKPKVIVSTQMSLVSYFIGRVTSASRIRVSGGRQSPCGPLWRWVRCEADSCARWLKSQRVAPRIVPSHSAKIAA
jgi:hypothetical protein